MASIHLHCLCPARTSLPILRSFATNRRSLLLPERNETRNMYRGVGRERKKVQWSIMASDDSYFNPIEGKKGELDKPPTPLSPSATIVKFYDCINEKNLKKLEEYIDPDCCLEDYTFFKPFEGRKEVMDFFEQLIKCMGKNVKFTIQSVCEGDQISVAVTWFLEWNEKRIPFTRGCSFYEFCKQGNNKLLIKHGRAVIESPIKPGTMALVIPSNLYLLICNSVFPLRFFLNFWSSR